MAEIENVLLEKGIYPVDSGSSYGEVLYGYTDIEEAKKDYKNETGEELDVENCQHINVMAIEDEKGTRFSWTAEDQAEGKPSIICIY